MQHPDTEQNVSPFPFRSHTALLMAAALPFLQPAYRHPVELALKFLEFSETMKFYREFHLPNVDSQAPLHHKKPGASEKSGIFDFISRFVSDPEGLLNNLSKVTTGKEREMVGMLLNLIRAKSFYEEYGDILNSVMSSGIPGISPEPQEPLSQESKPSEDFSMPDMANILSGGDLTSLLSKEQTDTLNLLKNLLEAE